MERPRISELGVSTGKVPSARGVLSTPIGRSFDKLAASNKTVWSSVGDNLDVPTEIFNSRYKDLILDSVLPCLQGLFAGLIAQVNPDSAAKLVNS